MANGFQVKNIVPGSVFEQLGVKKGDIIRDINGVPITSAESAFQAYQQLRDEPLINIGIERGGDSVELNYEIR